MAIRVRRGNQADFDGNKLVSGELGLVLDKGEVYFCYSPGNTKKLQTAEDLQNLLNASPEAYTALQQLIADLTADPNELVNILNNISVLQSGKIDKSSIVNTDTINDTTKVPSTAVTHALGLEIDALTNNLAVQMEVLGAGVTILRTGNMRILNIENATSDADNTISGALIPVDDRPSYNARGICTYSSGLVGNAMISGGLVYLSNLAGGGAPSVTGLFGTIVWVVQN